MQSYTRVYICVAKIVGDLSSAWPSAYAAMKDISCPLTVFPGTVHTCLIVVPSLKIGGPPRGDEHHVTCSGITVGVQ
jgi:hypothetical protein